MIILYILFSTYIIYRLITFPFIRILKMQLEHEPNKKLDPLSATTHNLTSFYVVIEENGEFHQNTKSLIFVNVLGKLQK